MQQIIHTLGHRGGPSGGSVDPRACKYCDYFGHTKQYCPKRMADMRALEERADDAVLAEHQKLFRTRRPHNAPIDPEWSAWVAWAAHRHSAALDKDLECERVAACATDWGPCMQCAGCKGFERFCAEWEGKNPEPPCRLRTSELGACTYTIC